MTAAWNAQVYYSRTTMAHVTLCFPLKHKSPALRTPASCQLEGRTRGTELTVLPPWWTAVFTPTLVPLWIITHQIIVDLFPSASVVPAAGAFASISLTRTGHAPPARLSLFRVALSFHTLRWGAVGRGSTLLLFAPPLSAVQDLS